MDNGYFLKSKRIGFRAWTLDDIELAEELWMDPQVTKYIGGPVSTAQVYNKVQTEKRLLRLYGFQYWPIFLLQTNEFIGCCGLHDYKPTERIYEIGFHIKPAFWQNDYASEAAKAVIKFAIANLDAAGFFAGHHPDNVISKRVLEKLGFKYFQDEYYQPTKLNHPSYILMKK